MSRLAISGSCVLASAVLLGAQAPPLGDAVRPFVSVDAPVVALTHARVIDGTGAPARPNQTLVSRRQHRRDRRRRPASPCPTGRTTIDLSGKSVMPGPRDGARAPLLPDRPRRLRPARRELRPPVSRRRRDDDANRREHERRMDIKLKRQIEAGSRPGPAIDATAPYLNGPQDHAADARAEGRRRRAPAGRPTGPTWARRRSRPTCRSRAPSCGAAIDEAHKRGLKITGHLCSVTYAEAADLGIDNLEHGFIGVHRFRCRQAAGRLSRAGASGSGRSPRSTKTARRSRRW